LKYQGGLVIAQLVRQLLGSTLEWNKIKICAQICVLPAVQLDV